MTWEELNEVRILNKNIDDITTEINSLRRSLSAKTPALDGLPKSTSVSSSVERNAIRIADAEKALEELKLRLAEAIPRLEKKIRDEVKNPITRVIFLFRYVDCMFFSDIAFKIGYSKQHVYSLHNTTYRNLLNR